MFHNVIPAKNRQNEFDDKMKEVSRDGDWEAGTRAGAKA
jgi:hypothetical protein